MRGRSAVSAAGLGAVVCLMAATGAAPWVAGAAPGMAVRSASAASEPCGTKTGPAPPTYRHVVVIMDENTSFSDVIGRPGSRAANAAPYLNQLASACGLATNYHAVTHPSHPNYTAATGGVSTMRAYLETPTIFRQVERLGRAWRSYNESMPVNCGRLPLYPYKPEHNPGLAYSRVAANCLRWDVSGSALAADIGENRLPAYAFVTPNQCHNMHASCTRGTNAIRAGDNWLRTWIGRLVHTPDYVAGRTAIFITWDEGSHGQTAAHRGEDCLAPAKRSDETCHVATLVLSAYIAPATRSGRSYSHYSLLQTCERLLGIPTFIGHADDPTTTGMRRDFGF